MYLQWKLRDGVMILVGREGKTVHGVAWYPRIWPVTISPSRTSAKRCFFWLGLLLHEGYKHTNSSNLESLGRSRPLIRSAARRSQKRKVISIMSNGDIRKICRSIGKHRFTKSPGSNIRRALELLRSTYP